jgi:hypothetical protein
MSLELSYVVVTDTFDTIRHVVGALTKQTVRDRIELVIACRSESELQLDADQASLLGAVRIVEVDSVIPLSPSRAAAVRAASCSLVFIGETHSFPAPDCLEALLAAHRSGNYAAVTPVVENANPEKALSWAGLMLTYRHWIEPATRGEIAELATYNACYQRDLLLSFGDRLTQMLDYGSGLDTELRAAGGPFLIEPAARLAHLNVGSLTGFVPERFLSGRFWAVARARRWTTARRLLYVVAAPLIPLLIAGKAVRSTQWQHHRSRMPRGTLAAVLACAAVTAAGEVTGYVAGSGRTAERLGKYELYRSRYL